ncbi:MAG: hypothetical protein KDD25_05640 [Bdellovibrionales bacterium]|nr:hypothetical protein [Bdellovibrionales bacterium]
MIHNQLMSNHTALVPGSSLWVVPDIEHSSWTSRINWYIGFQVTRAQLHKPSRLKDVQLRELNELDLPTYDWDYVPEMPLMIGTANYLPNQQTAVLKYAGDFSAWLDKVKMLWNKMAQPRMRIFLPTGISLQDIISHWNDLPSEITLVEDSMAKR